MDEKEAEARPVMGTIFLVYIYYVYGQTRLHYPARLRAGVIMSHSCTPQNDFLDVDGSGEFSQASIKKIDFDHS